MAGLRFHPRRGTIVIVDFDQAFRPPEMVKRRPCVILSNQMKDRPGLATVVPLSTTPPPIVERYHCQLEIPFELPAKWANPRPWLKGDMVYTLNLSRMRFMLLGKDRTGERVYQRQALGRDQMAEIERCVKFGLGLAD